jgi:hypothetical protein
VILANSHGCHIPKLTANDAAAPKTIKRPITLKDPPGFRGSGTTAAALVLAVFLGMLHFT